ncbi:hypothetical protein GG344DRAFT_70683 [Lentinula edodes]|nr:hypothetical protein GG344DRAFT_70683 [Lentinula edodes]
MHIYRSSSRRNNRLCNRFINPDNATCRGLIASSKVSWAERMWVVGIMNDREVEVEGEGEGEGEGRDGGWEGWEDDREDEDGANAVNDDDVAEPIAVDVDIDDVDTQHFDDKTNPEPNTTTSHNCSTNVRVGKIFPIREWVWRSRIRERMVCSRVVVMEVSIEVVVEEEEAEAEVVVVVSIEVELVEVVAHLSLPIPVLTTPTPTPTPTPIFPKTRKLKKLHTPRPHRHRELKLTMAHERRDEMEGVVDELDEGTEEVGVERPVDWLFDWLVGECIRDCRFRGFRIRIRMRIGIGIGIKAGGGEVVKEEEGGRKKDEGRKGKGEGKKGSGEGGKEKGRREVVKEEEGREE